MVIVGIKDGVIDICVSVDNTGILAEMYPEHLLIEQTGSETVGWTYDGVSFSAPVGG